MKIFKKKNEKVVSDVSLDSCNLVKSEKLDVDGSDERPLWNNRVEFLLAAVGYAVGLGNIWRFPWLLIKNGGGAFLIPYFIMLFIQGVPLFFLELAIGQRYRLAPLLVWKKMSKYAHGIGVAQFYRAIINRPVSFIVNSWAIYYFFASFHSTLPWSSCSRMNPNKYIDTETNKSICSKLGAPMYYWYYEVMNISNGINDTNFTMNWKLTLSMFTVGLVTCLCLIKGVKSTGKVVYFTVIFPYVGIFIFLIRGLTLDGSMDGLKFLFRVDISRLADPNVWMQATTQIFWTLSLGTGGMITYASYNPTHQNVFTDVIIVTAVNTCTSLLSGLAVFALLGHRAYVHNRNCESTNKMKLAQINQLVNATLYKQYQPQTMNSNSFVSLKEQLFRNVSSQYDIQSCSIRGFLEKTPSGSGIAFTALTEVINELPGATFFSLAFFLMLITVALDSIFGSVESTVSSIKDTKRFMKYKVEIVTALVCLVSCIMALPFVTGSGEYFFQLMNTYSIDIPYLLIVLAETVTVSYVYGLKRFCSDIEMMTGKKVHVIFKALWSVVSPAILLGLFIMTIVNFNNSGSYQVWSKDQGTLRTVTFPVWSTVFGWLIMMSQVLCIPCFGLYAYIKQRKLDTTENLNEKTAMSKREELETGMQ